MLAHGSLGAVIQVPPLPYSPGALAPYLSERAVHFHRRKHERYVARTNELVKGTALEGLPLGALVRETERSLIVDQDPSEWVENLFDQASQAWNHQLMWLSMAPPSRRTSPRNELEEEWKEAAMQVFGAGWVWLVLSPEGEILVESTADAERPILGQPLAVMDVWEHAYYLDYPDAKADYVEAWWHDLSYWDVAAQIARGNIPEALR